jgi:hypothetical protein
LYGNETWTLRKLDQKYLEISKYGAGEGRRRSVGPIVLETNKYYSRVKEGKNILHTMKIKANRIGHMLRRNCLLKRVVEEKLQVRKEVTVRREQSSAATG